ncbi:Enolase-phosphatase E1 [Araneus ventricosus]|uniref:Enolase-phosphatase E1 n=1 Tax=Araneus ventricosus TaxID=182803 RepID=A0A4Y2BBH8_ARAVE|nr:Enolase-phosphatase E1 [Araneus ventricosus]
MHAMSEDKALSLLINGKLTKFQYNLIRNSALEEDSTLYPNYEAVIKAKRMCYPKNIFLRETSAQAPLQDLLNHTVKRLVKSLDEVFLSFEDNVNNICLISKWGIDGSSGQSEYKQHFEDTTATGASIFVSSLVPLKLIFGSLDEQHTAQWQNPRPSSPRYCRPIRLQFVPKSTQILKQEADIYSDAVKALKIWSGESKLVYTYSTGSRATQVEYFKQTILGDVSNFIKGYFDTSIGSKLECEGFKFICSAAEVDPSEIVFFSDRPKEIIAAKKCGLKAILVDRESEFSLIREEQDFLGHEDGKISSFTEILSDS